MYIIIQENNKFPASRAALCPRRAKGHVVHHLLSREVGPWLLVSWAGFVPLRTQLNSTNQSIYIYIQLYIYHIAVVGKIEVPIGRHPHPTNHPLHAAMRLVLDPLQGPAKSPGHQQSIRPFLTRGVSRLIFLGCGRGVSRVSSKKKLPSRSSSIMSYA